MIFFGFGFSGIHAPEGPKPPPYRFGHLEAYRRPILQTSRAHGVHPCLVAAILLTETDGSHYHKGQVIRGRAGEIGIAQIMPVNVRDPRILFEPNVNIFVSGRLLSEAIAYKRGDVLRGVSAYNTGPYVAWHQINWKYIARFRRKLATLPGCPSNLL